MSFDLWRAFRGEIFGWIICAVLGGAALTLLLYTIQSRKLTIRSPQDPFRSFSPLRWLWLSFFPGFFMAVVYAVLYSSVFPQTVISPAAGAVGSALVATFGNYVIAQVAVWLPGVTPRKFLYHPRWPWRLFGRRRS